MPRTRTWIPAPLYTSARLLSANPGISLLLGAGIVLALVAVSGGFGALVAPWFVCELYSVQLASVSEGPPRARDRSWLAASVVVLLTVLVVACAGWLAAIGFGPDVVTADASVRPLPWPEALRRVGLIAGAAALAVGFSAPFSYAPLILIDRGGRLGSAVIESAYLVDRDGPLRHLGLAFAANLLSLSPALLAAIAAARVYERAATPLGLLAALPLLPASIPLGLGMLTAAYLARRQALGDVRRRAREAPLPRGLVLLHSAVVVAPVVGLVLVAAAALRPALPRRVGAPEGELVASATVVGDAAIVDVPGTTLYVRTEGRRVFVHAGDADGVGLVPSPWDDAPIERVRVVRSRDDYAVAIDAGATYVLWVDRAGERVDDSIRARLEQHVPSWALASVVLAFVLCALLAVPAIAPLGEARARDAPTGAARERLRAQRTRRSMRVGLLLLPPSLLALVGGVVCHL